MKAAVDEVGLFYRTTEPSAASHLALRWKGRMRYAVPLDARAQRACWQLFQPGRLELPLRVTARLPRVFGVVSCVESEKLALIREAIGREAGVSSCRAGTPGPWTKDTILLLDHAAKPLLIVKAGKGEAVDRLLRNEAEWLRSLRNKPQLAGHVPEMVAHQSGTELSFVAQSLLPGRPCFKLGEPHINFLKKFQEASRRSLRYEESKLYRNLQLRMKDLDGHLTGDWARRIEKAMRRIQDQFSGAPILMTAAHNDFAPWNIRIEGGVARIFDWEYADEEQLPLFDLLHFALMPMALKREAPAKIIRKMRETLRFCEPWLGKESCAKSETQALAYLVNLCTLFLWPVNGKYDKAPALDTYALVIDRLCGRQEEMHA
jgi:hypothetical protein